MSDVPRPKANPSRGSLYTLTVPEGWEAPEEEEETTKRTAEEVAAEIIEFFENNEDIYNEAIEELDGYGYLGDDRYFSMDELDELHKRHRTERAFTPGVFRV